MVRPLARLEVRPNQVTAVSLWLALLAAGLFAAGEPSLAHWAAGLFVLARFLDHCDGELARLTGTGSRLGYYFDYAAGAVSYAALFLGLGLGLSEGALGAWAYVLGGAGEVSALGAAVLNLELDRQYGLTGGEAVGYPAFQGFELEDGIYLIAPATWLGWLTPFFAVAAAGAAVCGLWTLARVVRIRLANRHGAARS